MIRAPRVFSVLESRRAIRIAFCALAMFIAQLAIAEDCYIDLQDGKRVILHDDFTWEYYETPKTVIDTSSIQDNQIPSFLRQGITADRETIITAVELYSQSWRYFMPRPKSAQAAWGNTDGRTTWWYGYWVNVNSQKVSARTPIKRQNGLYYGDEQDQRSTWRNGGSPRFPTKIEWLLSQSGGVAPR